MADFNKVVGRGIVWYAITAFLFFSLVSWASSASIQ